MKVNTICTISTTHRDSKPPIWQRVAGFVELDRDQRPEALRIDQQKVLGLLGDALPPASLDRAPLAAEYVQQLVHRDLHEDQDPVGRDPLKNEIELPLRRRDELLVDPDVEARPRILVAVADQPTEQTAGLAHGRAPRNGSVSD